jgi:hypothetical protein
MFGPTCLLVAIWQVVRICAWLMGKLVSDMVVVVDGSGMVSPCWWTDDCLDNLLMDWWYG